MSAEVIVFPCKARVGRARKAAATISMAVSSRDFRARWNQTNRILREQLNGIGFSHEVIELEVASFSRLIESELVKVLAPGDCA